jgi:protein O-GlcNAc transferase
MKQQLPNMSCSLDRAEALHREGRYEEATRLCRNVLLQDKDNLEATFLLATIKYSGHHWHEAVTLYQRVCGLAPHIGFLRVNLALALQELERFDEALRAFDEALKLDGPSVSLYYNRGVLLQRYERLDEARHEFEYALALEPGHVSSWINLSAVYLAIDDTDGAVRCCHHGLYLDNANVALTANLATAYSKAFRFEESLVWHQRLLKLVVPGEQAEVLGRMANCLSDNWMVDEAITCFDQAIISSCDEAQKRALLSTRLFVLHYSPHWTAQAIASEHGRWGEHFFAPSIPPLFLNNPDPNRPIRIAYLSPDLRIHAVVFFLQPVLAAHDPAQVTVYCYSDVRKPDAVTRQLKEQHGVIWRDCSRLDDDRLLAKLREDQIDILVDLAGHTAGNRLPLFARHAAPLQVTWIGYPNTTGLVSMDYRISDAWADPPGMTEHLHTEKLLRMPDSFLCYRPGGDFPDAGEPPCLSSAQITFGSFSNFMKVTPVVLNLWARVLAGVYGSRLVFRARGITSERFKSDIAPIFIAQGVDPQRVQVLGHARSVVENLQDYNRIDIALDTFPYNGTTTTCESLCMGVPVITLAGDAHVSRVGISLLNTVGLPELIAQNQEEYLAIAVRLARDISRLRTLRHSLRERLMASPLTDNVTFTRNLERLYRQIWRRWCQGHS